MPVAQSRLTADAIAELAYQAYEFECERVRKQGHNSQKGKPWLDGWSFLSNRQQINYIKLAHRKLEKWPPLPRIEEINRLARLWNARPRNVKNENGEYGPDTQRVTKR